MFVEPSTPTSSKGWVKKELGAVFFCVHLRWVRNSPRSLFSLVSPVRMCRRSCPTRMGGIQELYTPCVCARKAWCDHTTMMKWIEEILHIIIFYCYIF
ncbi:hypothetical protein JG688_00017301 [Phytophthora aleatoria]|uniref:Uncharacterized protein n=1 Tax=Phytophthora aleatoria TaxID=2496075 RepID=A0A8J5IE34_9STRA|nr:hypothetical protein JG688_00017301 [Phytophthora aleatoria]